MKSIFVFVFTIGLCLGILIGCTIMAENNARIEKEKMITAVLNSVADYKIHMEYKDLFTLPIHKQ